MQRKLISIIIAGLILAGCGSQVSAGAHAPTTTGMVRWVQSPGIKALMAQSKKMDDIQGDDPEPIADGLQLAAQEGKDNPPPAYDADFSEDWDAFWNQISPAVDDVRHRNLDHLADDMRVVTIYGNKLKADIDRMNIAALQDLKDMIGSAD